MLQDSLLLLNYIHGMLVNNQELWLLLFPVMILIELPLYLLVFTGIFRWSYEKGDQKEKYFPSVSFVVTCYGEGEAISVTIDTLIEQIYPGAIEILVVVDGAVQNQSTYQAALKAEKRYSGVSNRHVRVVPKWQRGGRVSACNAALSVASGEIFLAVDGDTSFDNDMLYTMIQQFGDKNVIASGGTLRVRNHDVNILTKMQSLEYVLSIQSGKTGMAEWGVLNNISGAFGAFRKDNLIQVGGWDTHTAEDLDLTIRLRQYKRRYPHQQIRFATHAIGHTDVPESIKDLVLQRLRWDGDLLFLFFRKHKDGFSPSLLGWGNFLFTLVYGVVQNILLPLLTALFTLYMIAFYPFNVVLALLLLLYLTYLSVLLMTFVVHVGLVSERRKQDIKLCWWLPAYPVYQFCIRLVTAFSMINEAFRRSHEESGMAPWWVLKRGKKF